ncbi:MAG: hypothetical protein IPG50_25425 [Myxococcales bacterium]|nr:hypothetical protein [Myxococcales bacterium]
MRSFTSLRSALPVVLACELALAVAVLPRVGAAQTIGDADRKAARELYFQGEGLQNTGKFADALEKFQRAQSVVNAPTTLLHIAECQAALGKLVEAAETYRSVGRFNLPPNPPQAFVAAQSQAAGELAQLEPRIPELTVDVTPPNVPTLQVAIDDQPIPQALVGVPRPLNPGVHKVVAQAPGYSREEKSIEVKERSKQKVALDLKATGAVTYAPAGAAALSPAQPSPQEAARPDKPPPYDAAKEAPKEPEHRSRMSIMLGPRLGLTVPTGDLPLANGTTTPMKQFASAGASFGVQAAFRFVRVLFVGGQIQADGFGDGDKALTQKLSGGLGTFTFGWNSNPDGFGVILNVGGGYRWYTAEDTIADTGNITRTRTEKGGGGAAQFGFGLHIRVAKVLRLIPKAEVDFGTLKADTTTNPNADGRFTFVFLGLAGDFDINLDRGPAKSTATLRSLRF